MNGASALGKSRADMRRSRRIDTRYKLIFFWFSLASVWCILSLSSTLNNYSTVKDHSLWKWPPTTTDIQPKVASTDGNSTHEIEPLRHKIITACNQDFLEKALSLANQLQPFGRTLHIVPLNWDPLQHSARDNETNTLENNSTSSNIIYETPIANNSLNILSLKLATLASQTEKSPVNSTLLWLDSDTIILGDVHKITERATSNGCDISLKIRKGQCVDGTKPLPKEQLREKRRAVQYAAGVIAITVNSASRSFFRKAYEFSITGLPGSFKLERKPVGGGKLGMIQWFQDQLAFYELIEQSKNGTSTGSELKICGLNDNEMFIGPPHACRSPGAVNSSTITFSGTLH